MGWKPTDEFFNRGFDDVKDLVEHWQETYGADNYACPRCCGPCPTSSTNRLTIQRIESLRANRNSNYDGQLAAEIHRRSF